MDNCPGVYNPDQADADANGEGNACDCCIGRRGNVNLSPAENPSIADIAVLIDFMFITNTPLPCMFEADVNGSGGNNPQDNDISTSDVSTIIDYLFLTGAPLPSCP